MPATVEAWVDDLAQQSIGSFKSVVSSTVAAAVYLVEALQGKGAKMSGKSCLLSSSKQLGLEITQGLKSHLISVQHLVTARDLEINTSLQPRRRTNVARNRQMKAVARARVIKSFLESNQQSRKLLPTRVRPQAMWGHQAQGWAPSTLQRIRAVLVLVVGAERRVDVPLPPYAWLLIAKWIL